MEPGVYALVFTNPDAVLDVGRLGPVAFSAGFHVYIGSALGPGGLLRVERHLRLGRDRDSPPTWHVDRLLLDPRFRLVAAVTAVTTARLECALAGALAGASVRGFGSGDCRCRSHLFFRPGDPTTEIEDSFVAVGLVPFVRRLPDRLRKGYGRRR
jgi:Uri superfamily endonuclease